MLTWFKQKAPIRRKFDVLALVYTILCAAPIGAMWLSTGGRGMGAAPLGIAAAAVIGTIMVALVSRTLICDPYVNTVVRMEGLAAGDLASPVHYTSHDDCVGRMTRAMAVFMRNAETASGAAEREQVVSGLGTGLSRLATNDLTYRIETTFPAEYERLRLDFNRAMDAVTAVMTAVSKATSGINDGASDVRIASDDLSQRTEQQAASLEETAAAMDEITGTVRETAAGANRANAVVVEARAEAEQSGAIVDRAVEAMNGIERASSEINEIISVIDGIAFQTNLLALNAGVEAARAGDAGRGFAVVASEVRALAQRSAEAAKDVKAKITASSEQVDVGVKLVSETGEALQRIIGRIGEISTLVGAIAASAEQQSTGLQQVNTAVSEMDGVTQQNAAMVEQATAAARSLAQEADELARQVARFHLGDAIATRPAPQPATSTSVHELQDRAAKAGREIARTTRRRVAATTGLRMTSDEDWSDF